MLKIIVILTIIAGASSATIRISDNAYELDFNPAKEAKEIYFSVNYKSSFVYEASNWHWPDTYAYVFLHSAAESRIFQISSQCFPTRPNNFDIHHTY